MDDAKHQLVDRLKSANNVLVTVSRNPSVDQLAACLGLALLLNKQGKHTAAVFSGEVPSTLEFLKPEDTLEKNTDSLRDFIIALDKSKADKLRYKVEDNVVRIFITPYKTSISEADLEFSQGDFNVDLVVGLGVAMQEDLDDAITAHGRILHDATVASVNISGQGGLGSINWQDPQASSLSELMTDLAQALGPNLLDEQIATALLTGIVSATERFSNDKTTSQTMSASAALMAAGANQQLVASKLEEPEQPRAAAASDNQAYAQVATETPDGTIEIEHDTTASPEEGSSDHQAFELPAPDDTSVSHSSLLPIDGQANNNEPPVGSSEPALPSVNGPSMTPGAKLVSAPPSLGGTLTANAHVEGLDPSTDPLSLPTTELPQLLERRPTEQLTPPPSGWNPPAPEPDSVVATDPVPSLTNPDPVPAPTPPEPPAPPVVPEPPAPEPPAPPVPEPTPPPPPLASTDDKPASMPQLDQSTDMSLSDLEESVKESEAKSSSLDAVRDEVSRALTSSPSSTPPPPIEALNAQPLGDDLHSAEPAVVEPMPSADPVKPAPDEATTASTAQVVDPTAPPPVPPPIPFQFGNPSGQ